MTALRHFLLALQFFTRIPVTGRLADWVGFSPAMLRASAAYFPAVGVVIGGAFGKIVSSVVADVIMPPNQGVGSTIKVCAPLRAA